MTLNATLGPEGWEVDPIIGGGSSAITYSVVNNVSLQTSAAQGTAVAFAAAACNGMIVSAGITSLEYIRASDTAYHTVRPFETKFIFGISDASEVSFRRSDNATIRATQLTTVKATLINTSSAIASSNLALTTASNATYTAFASHACKAVEVTNPTAYDGFLRFGGSTLPVPIYAGQTLTIPVNANANEISAVSASNNNAITLIAESFQQIPTVTRRRFDRVTQISESAVIPLGEFSGNDPQISSEFAMIPSFAPFTKFNLKGKLVSIWNTAASTIVSGATVADTDVGNNVYATHGVTAAGGVVTAPVITSTANSFSFMTTVNTTAGIDVTNSAIHLGLSRLNFGQTVSTMTVDLFSAGTPGAPSADYHRLSVSGTYAQVQNVDLNDCFSPSRGFGAKSFGINRFAAVGAGATLTAITYARITINADAPGMQVMPSFIKAIKNYSNKGTIIFTIDDNYASAINNALPILAPYGFPAVLFPSPLTNKVGAQNNATGNWTIDQMKMLQDQFGWQIASQDFANASGIDGGENTQDRSNDEWFKLASRNLIAGAALGFDLDGMRDGSHPGGYTYPNSVEQVKKAQSLYASMRMFKNARNGNAATGPMALFCDTNPPANPWMLIGLNMGTGSFSSNITAANLAARYQELAQQAIDNKGLVILSAHDDWGNATVQAAMAIFLPWLAGQVSAGNAQVPTLSALRKQQSIAALAVN